MASPKHTLGNRSARGRTSSALIANFIYVLISFGCWPAPRWVALRGRSRRGGVHRHRSRSLCERTTVPSYVCCLARCTPFRNFCTFCQSFAVLHSICERRVGRTVCTWMSCTMSGNFDFYSPFIIRRLAPRAKCWRRLLFVFCRIFLCFSPVYALLLYRTATTPSEKFLHILFILFHSVHSKYKAFPSLEPHERTKNIILLLEF